MKPFRYALDPVCLAGVLIYAANRWLVKPHLASVFLRNHFNDLLLLPCLLPPVLWLHRRLGWRRGDDPPAPAEIVFHWVVWSVFFEVLGPQLDRRVTGDWRDVVAYAVGGLLAGVWWNRHRWSQPTLIRRTRR